MAYRYRATPQFWRSYAKLTENQQASALRAYRIFKGNPFDPRLRTHKIASLSARFGRTIHSVWIESDLRAVFYLDGSDCISVDIGTHAIYRYKVDTSVWEPDTGNNSAIHHGRASLSEELMTESL